ncbi:MAG TPA: hypothetical protein VFL28_01465 [bacterium]|nr:hypothetical protein [bacterium]
MTGEQLRKRVEQLESELQERARFLAAREAKLRELEQRAHRVGGVCLETAQTLVASTNQPILLQFHVKIGPARFRIRAGSVYSLVAKLTDEGWDVAAYLRTGVRRATFATDEEFLEARMPLLEDVIADAVMTLLAGRDVFSPAPPPQPKEPFWVPWQKMFGARFARPPAQKTA